MTAKLSAALLKAQAAMPAVKDDAKANYGTYVTLDHLIASTRGILNDHGLVITQLPAVSELGQPVLRTILMHAESGESIQADTPLILTQQNMQQLGAAITYARRYAWSAALGIADQEDDDGARASAPAPKPQAAKPAEKSGKEEKTGFTDPTGEHRSDAQAKLLFQLATKLTKSGAITLEQLLKAGEGVGVEGAEGIQSLCERISKGGASNLIERLKNLEKNTAEKVAA